MSNSEDSLHTRFAGERACPFPRTLPQAPPKPLRRWTSHPGGRSKCTLGEEGCFHGGLQSGIYRISSARTLSRCLIALPTGTNSSTLAHRMLCLGHLALLFWSSGHFNSSPFFFTFICLYFMPNLLPDHRFLFVHFLLGYLFLLCNPSPGVGAAALSETVSTRQGQGRVWAHWPTSCLVHAIP